MTSTSGGRRRDLAQMGRRFLLVLSVASVSLLVHGGSATAAVSESVSLPPGSNPNDIVAPPAGSGITDLFFSMSGTHKIGRLNPTTGQVVQVYDLPGTAGTDRGVDGITFGPDNNIWYAEPLGRRIGRLIVTGPQAGQITEFSQTAGGTALQGNPAYLTRGPGTSLWFTEPTGIGIGRDTIGMIDTANPNAGITEYSVGGTGILRMAQPLDITLGPDNNVWFAESGPAVDTSGGSPAKNPGVHIGRVITTGSSTGQITEFDGMTIATDGARGITTGPDGNLWFTKPDSRIGRVTPAGQITEFGAGTGISPRMGITTGPDGNLWFTQDASGDGTNSGSGEARLGRITTSGQITEYCGLTPKSDPRNIASAGGRLWFTEFANDKIGYVTVDTPPCTSPRLPVPGPSKVPANEAEIAFARWVIPESGTRNFEIFKVDAEGVETRLTNDPSIDDRPDITSDGKKIVWQRSNQIHTMDADGTKVQRITNNSASDQIATWSPDGTKIAFASNREGNQFDIYIMNADGSNQTRLTDHPTRDYDPAFSPDGTKIAFGASRDGNGEIYVMNVDGSGETNVSNDPLGDSYPTWSPDGKKITFHRSLLNPGMPSSNPEIYVMNADGSTQTRLTYDLEFDNYPDFSPDGKKIVWTTYRPGLPSLANYNAQLYVMDADGSNPRRLTYNRGGEFAADWDGPIRRPAQVRPPAPRPPAYPQPAATFPGCPTLTANVIRGTAASNSIVGTRFADRIFAGTGNDTVDGLAGNDCIDLGPGTDRGQGGTGSDLIVGGLGGDRLSGSSGNDRLRGNSGDDRIDGGRGNDRAFGDSGNDRILGSFGNDRLHGVGGRDRISGSRGRDRINGGSSNDVISAGSSGDRVAGDQGHDRINGNSGNDSLSGNSGNDRITGSTGADRLSGNSGNDRINARDGRRDRVNCGRGRDAVVADRIDIVSRNCERVRRRGR